MPENPTQSPPKNAGRSELAGISARAMNVLVSGPGYEGYVAIDTIVNGTSAGGVRATEDLDLDEVRELAHEMSLKYALFHLPRGGAKAGVRLATGLDATARTEAFTDFGRKLAPLIRNGIYYPGMDMNCGPNELRAIYSGAGIGLGEVTDTSWFTALTVFQALQACVSVLGIEHRPITLAIEGFGSVARHLADRLETGEYRIAVVSTVEGAVRANDPYDPSDLANRKASVGDRFVLDLPGERIDSGDVFTSSVDFLLPSSRTWMLTTDLAAGVRARAIVPIANAPYAAGSLDLLDEKGVVCLPGYLSNVGGVLASSLYDQGVAIPVIETMFSGVYREIVESIVRVGQQQNVSVVELAASLAKAHMANRTAWKQQSLPRRIYDRFLRRRLSRWIGPRNAMKAFSQRMESLRAEIERMERRR